MFKSTPKTAAQILQPFTTKVTELRESAAYHLTLAQGKRQFAQTLIDEAVDLEAEFHAGTTAADNLEAFIGGLDANI